MATSGSFNTTGYSATNAPDYYTFSWTLLSQSTSGNYSVISWSVTAGGGKNEYHYVYVQEKYVTVNGETQNNSTQQQTYNGTMPFSGTTTIYHDADGKKTFSAAVGGAFEVYGAYNSTGSGTWELPVIARASAITSAADITIGQTCNIKWTPASSNFKYKIKFVLGAWNYTTGFISPNTTNAYTYKSYTISGTTTANGTTIYQQMPSAVADTMNVYLYTYDSNSTRIGEPSQSTFVVTIPDTVKPTIGSIQLTPQTYTCLVQGKNAVQINATGCAGGTGSSIKSYTFSGPGLPPSQTTVNNSVITNIVSSEGNLEYTVTVRDSRNRVTTQTATIKCYAYQAPYFKSFSVYRCDVNGNANESGTYVKCVYEPCVSAVDGNNTSTIQFFYKLGKNAEYSSVSLKSGGVLNAQFDANATYNIYATISDKYGNGAPSSMETVFGASRILNITEDGTGVAIGKMAEKTEHFDVRWESHFGNNVNIDGDVTASNLLQAKTLWSSVEPSNGTITITLGSGDNLDSYVYLEIYYVDNNGRGHGYTKVYQPNGAVLHLSLIEASTNTSLPERTYIRRTVYSITGNSSTVTITPQNEGYGYVMIKAPSEAGDPLKFDTANNYIKIARVVGYK